MIHELPYMKDSIDLFKGWADKEWSVFLDSGFPYTAQGRYDFITAQPYKTLVTRGGITEIRSRKGLAHSSDDPFTLVKEHLGDAAPSCGNLPFSGGAMGYFGYDLARRLEILPTIARDVENIPEMMIGVYDWAVVVDHKLGQSWLVAQGRDPATSEIWSDLLFRFEHPPAGDSSNSSFRIIDEVSSNMSEDEYIRCFRRIKRYLREGDCYQVNLAQRFFSRCEGSSWRAYRILRQINAAPFSSFLHFPQVRILSSSPERFLKLRHGIVETKPIKGTRPRGKTSIEDLEQIKLLEESAKDRAENLMIVDLLRNDIGKNCKPGSVTVPKLFNIESFATVHHLVSTVCGELAARCHALDLLRGCFPGGSITGAPKLRAMEIIEELEPNRRGAYCGSIGYIGFDGSMDTNIAIRTLVHSDNQIRFWAGGGIVADSRESEEYQESFDKAAAMLNLLEKLKVNPETAYVGR